MNLFRLPSGTILVAALVAAGTAQAEPVSQPQTGSSSGARGSPTIELLYDFGSETRYETTLSGYGGIAFDIKRKAILARLTYGDFFLVGGAVHDTRIDQANEVYYPMPMDSSSAYGYPRYDEPEAPVGRGFMAAVGLQNRVWAQDRFALQAYGQLSFRRESYDSTATYVSYPVYAEASPDIMPLPEPQPEPITYTETYEIDLSGVELTAGLIASCSGTRYTVYAGIEVLAYSDMEADLTVTSSDGSRYSDVSDLDRDDLVTLLLGLRASFDRAFLVVETRSLGENSLRAGAGLTF